VSARAVWRLEPPPIAHGVLEQKSIATRSRTDVTRWNSDRSCSASLPLAAAGARYDATAPGRNDMKWISVVAFAVVLFASGKA
jgi:hypothetical protein